MLKIDPLVTRVKALLDEDTDASVTYAALEARLALEKVVYDRLRQRYDYISHADLRGWNPNYVITTIMTEVDPNVTETLTLAIGKHPGSKPEEDEFVDVGTEVGFNAAAISKMWNALAGLALHIRLPNHKDDVIPDYGDRARIRAKVEEVVVELERLAKGTMVFSGLGYEVSFTCECGQLNKRKSRLLTSGKSISCFNPACSCSFTVEIHDDGDIYFELENFEIPCASCGTPAFAPRRELLKMKYGEPKVFDCVDCGHPNRVMWILARADLPKDGSTTAKALDRPLQA